MILEPVRPIQLSDIEQPRDRIAKTIVRTPLIRLELRREFAGHLVQAGESFRAATFANLTAPARAGDCRLRLATPG